MAGNGGSTSYRNIPDVALTADNVYVIYDNGSGGECWRHELRRAVVGGFHGVGESTSGGHGKPSVGFINPAIYAIGARPSYATYFHDITTGNNTWSEQPESILRGGRLRSLHRLGHAGRTKFDQCPCCPPGRLGDHPLEPALPPAASRRAVQRRRRNLHAHQCQRHVVELER